MRKWIKGLLKISAVVLIIGIVLGGIGFAMRGGKPFGLSFRNGKIVTTDDEGSVFELPKTTIESFSSINIDVAYADIEIIPTSGEYAIEYSIAESEPEYSVTNGELVFTAEGSQDSISIIGVSSQKYVKIYVPEGELFTNITIDDNYGDVTISNINISTLDLNLDYGDVELTNVNVDTRFDVDSSYGDVNATSSSFSEISADLSYGDLEFDDVAITGLATINDSCGDIEIALNNGDCTYDLNTSCGDITVNGQEMDDGVDQYAEYQGSSGAIIMATDSYGDIEITY